MKKFLIISVILIIALFSVYSFYKKDEEKISYETVNVDVGDIDVSVLASGAIEPINVVSVGTQVSGIIEKVYVDYNSKVKKDELLAELDKSLLLEDLNESEANFNKTKTALNFAKINYKRNKELFSKDYISKLDLEESEVKFAEAKASYETALSKLKKAKKNLGYARITSPISGVIISKEVESGQTVASSFQTPTLFEIAEDLTKMQISALVSESDIGMIKMNQEVDFTVDAYPLKTFKGKVSQIRLNPTTESNVVMYTVVIAFDNNTMELLPGMTAFVTIKIDSLKKVIRIPNMAFQYRPYPVKEKISNNEAFVYLLDKEGKEQRVLIKKGLSNSTHTEVLEGLKDKDKIIYEAIGGVIKGSKKRR